MEPSIYQYPDVFRRAHMESPGEIPAEVAFLKQVWGRHMNRPVRRVLEIGCGDSPHGIRLARDGFNVVGIDRSAHMIAAGRCKAGGVGNLRFYRRQIERFSLPERPFDSAIFMCETFPVITENADLLSHLKCVGRMLRHGGLYCVDIDRQDTDSRVNRRTLWRSRESNAGGVPLRIREFNRPSAWNSPLHSTYELECTIHFHDGAVRTRDLIPVRYTLPSTLELAALASGMFEMVAAYADLSFSKPIEKCRYRWWGILRRV
jgi:SAM-dependent methyltransferase